MTSLPDGRDDLEPGEAMRRCFQALDPIRPDLPAAQVYATLAAGSRSRSWRTRSGWRRGADTSRDLPDPTDEDGNQSGRCGCRRLPLHLLAV